MIMEFTIMGDGITVVLGKLNVAWVGRLLVVQTVSGSLFVDNVHGGRNDQGAGVTEIEFIEDEQEGSVCHPGKISPTS